MAEWRLSNAPVPFVSTFEFHQDRPRAPHLEQELHRPRLLYAARLVRTALRLTNSATLSDLGCGDGGLLSLLANDPVDAWGYDFAPANEAGWVERGVKAQLLDCFDPANRDQVRLGDVVVLTETLEHLADPHGVVEWVSGHCKALVASSPFDEHPGWYDECHAWAWDRDGYDCLLQSHGLRVVRHDNVTRFQCVLSVRL